MNNSERILSRADFVAWGSKGGKIGVKTERRKCPECGKFVSRAGCLSHDVAVVIKRMAERGVE